MGKGNDRKAKMFKEMRFYHGKSRRPGLFLVNRRGPDAQGKRPCREDFSAKSGGAH
jgi:hypothetical protein